MDNRSSSDGGITNPGSTSPFGRALRSRRTQLILLVVVATSLVAFVMVRWSGSTPNAEAVSPAVSKAIKDAVAAAKKEAASAPAASAAVYRRIQPSLVYIETNEKPSAVTDTSASDSDKNYGLGAGVIVNADGSILTANHVIANASSITVTFADGTSSPAEVVSSEPERDIAVLKAQRGPEVVVPAVLGGGVGIGDEVFAVGHPFGLIGSLSAGVVSGLGRQIPVESGQTLTDLIQFDAAVNPGNSGGPLLNSGGQVVGIVTALANPAKAGFFVGIGFAVPIAQAGGAAGGPPQ
jgi:S1-C subfamily serine protease